jgi:hypothetical protein
LHLLVENDFSTLEKNNIFLETNNLLLEILANIIKYFYRPKQHQAGT